ncbi:hypothetical protein BH11PAT2_BH11PAT2_03970 [soil metagenome]
MRKLIVAAIAASLTVGLASAASAAEYTVKPGDTLTRIAIRTSHTVRQLSLMSGIRQTDHIKVGQKITYFDENDIVDAIKWCERRIRELPADDQNAIFFAYTADDLMKGHVRYSIDEPNGTHFSNILVFAQAWRNHT